MKNICIKCGVDLYAAEGRFECQKHPKECKGIYLSEETLLIHAAEQKQHLIDMMKADEELGLYEEPKQVMKTAVSWLVEQLKGKSQSITWNEIFNKAKEMEKQQIIDAWLSAWKDSMLNPLEDKYYQPEAEQYYNETFKKE